MLQCLLGHMGPRRIPTLNLRSWLCTLVVLLFISLSPVAYAEDDIECVKPFHISTVLEEDLLAALTHIEKCAKEDTKLKVYVSGEGGPLIFAQAFYDKMRTSGLSKRVRFEAHGLIASASNIVWMASDERVVTPGSLFVLHRAKFGVPNGEDPELSISLKNAILQTSVDSVRRVAGSKAADLWEQSLVGKVVGNTLDGKEALEIGWATELSSYK